MTSIVANRIYHRQGFRAEDFKAMGPNVVLLRGCKPPSASEGGILLDAGPVEHPVRACAAFEIVMLQDGVDGYHDEDNPLGLRVGDTVLCRNALVDPLLGNELAICDIHLGIVAVLERAR